MAADLGGDGEARRHQEAQRRHLGQVRALAAQEIAHRGVTVGRTAAKAVNPFGHALVNLYCFSREQTQPVGAQIGVLGIHHHAVEELVNGTAQLGHRFHGEGILLGSQRRLGAARRLVQVFGQGLLHRVHQDVRAQASPVGRLVALFLDANDIFGPLVSSQEVFSIFRVKKVLERVDTGQQAHQIVFAAEGENRGNQVVAHALVPQRHLQPVGEEFEQRPGDGRPGKMAIEIPCRLDDRGQGA
jgi:hypothetical protein